MSDLKALLAAYAAGKWDEILRECDVEYKDAIFSFDGYLNEEAASFLQRSKEHAATAHVLTLLVGEMALALKKATHLVDSCIEEDELGVGVNSSTGDTWPIKAEYVDMFRNTLALAAMLTNPTQQAEEK